MLLLAWATPPSVYSEPNFFNDTQWPVFLEAWRRAHEIVRGRFRLVGPSTASAYYKGRLTSFIEYVAERNCAPDVLSWCVELPAQECHFDRLSQRVLFEWCSLTDHPLARSGMSSATLEVDFCPPR